MKRKYDEVLGLFSHAHTFRRVMLRVRSRTNPSNNVDDEFEEKVDGLYKHGLMSILMQRVRSENHR